MHISYSSVRVEVKTPQDVTVFRKDKTNGEESGFVNIAFTIPVEPMFGNWTVVALYGKEFKFNSSVQFEIKEYVLPTFSVQIEPPNDIMPDAQHIRITTRAKYVYGKAVRGNAYLRLGILEFDGTNSEIFNSALALGNGECLFEVETAGFDEGWFEEYVNHRLHVTVTVVEAATGTVENGTDISARFLRTPYRFITNSTLKYFKQGMPFEVKVTLLYANGRPASDINIEVFAIANMTSGERQRLDGRENHGTRLSTNSDGKVNFQLDVPFATESIHITLNTTEQKHNAHHEFDLAPYQSADGGSTILIRLTTAENLISVGEDINADLTYYSVNSEVPLRNLHFFVVAQGKILHHDSIYKDIASTVTSFVKFKLQAAMVPLFRLVVYYIKNGEVVADSLLVEATRDCENDVSLTFGDDDTSIISISPDEPVTLKVKAEPNTKVGLLVVDKAVYLLNDQHQLTRDKMFNRVAEYDLGCGPGGGIDNAAIFKDAGLTVITNANLAVTSRAGAKCPTVEGEVSRRRRSLFSQLSQHTLDSEEYLICQRGHTIIRPIRRWTCNRRLNRLKQEFKKNGNTLSDELSTIFIECCEHALFMSQARSDLVNDIAHIDVDPSQLNFRTDFQETWENFQFTIPSSGVYELPMQSPGSITEWSFQAVGISHDKQMCVAHPKDLKVLKDVFIQLKMPYSVVRNEQVEILATVFNYNPTPIKAKVYFRTWEGLCAENAPGEASVPRNITVPQNDAVSVRYVVIPVETGEHIIEVAAFTTRDSDGIQKKLYVEPEGVHRTDEYTILLDPEQEVEQYGDQYIQRDGHQYDSWNIHVPDNAVPDSQICKVNIIGRLIGPAVTTVLEDLDNLIQVPYGCGEQMMVKTAPNVYVAKYLIGTNTLTEEKKNILFSHIQNGYLGEQVYRRSEGSFSAYGERKAGSTWLSAFVAKVFCHSIEYTEVIDPKVTCGTLKWIMDHRQNYDGSFVEQEPVNRQVMMGGVREDGSVAMSAFILTAFQSCHCPHVPGYNQAIAKAVSYLEKKVAELNRPYTAAIVTYALALANSRRKTDANEKLIDLGREDLASKTLHWSFGIHSAQAVETAGYALLAQIALDDDDHMVKIVRWLTKQQGYTGAYGTTQDTVVSLQALAEYEILEWNPDINLRCDYNITSPKPRSSGYTISGDNAFLQREEVYKSSEVAGKLEVLTTGHGTGVLRAQVSYNVVPGEDDELEFEVCAFEIITEVTQVEQNEYNIQVCIQYLQPGEETGMAIADIGIFSGFKANEEDLKALVKNDTLPVARYEQSQRSVILYFDRITHTEMCLKFKIIEEIKVGNIQAVPVTVYDYYKPVETCTKFYRPPSGSTLMNPICEGQTCICSSVKCTTCKPKDNDELIKFACDSSEAYVYEVAIANANITQVEGFFVFQVQIINPLKKGNDDVEINQFRKFWMKKSCNCPDRTNIIPGNRFIIVGKKYLAITDNGEPSAKYYLDEISFVEYWPDPNVKGKRIFHKLRKKLPELKEALNRGCQT